MSKLGFSSQITRAGFACVEMIHGFKEGWIIWHPRGYPRGLKQALRRYHDVVNLPWTDPLTTVWCTTPQF